MRRDLLYIATLDYGEAGKRERSHGRHVGARWRIDDSDAYVDRRTIARMSGCLAIDIYRTVRAKRLSGRRADRWGSHCAGRSVYLRKDGRSDMRKHKEKGEAAVRERLAWRVKRGYRLDVVRSHIQRVNLPFG